MAESLRPEIETHIRNLDGLIQRGRQLRDSLAADPSSQSALASTRIWQQDCGITINQLSGGSKAHWLARSFSEAFLMRSADGGVIESAAASQIVQRLIDVLERARASLSGMGHDMAVPELAEAAPAPRRFGFVHAAELRPIVEQAFADGRRALEEGRYVDALLSFCAILDAIVTDALEHTGAVALTAAGAPHAKLAEWPFQARLEIAAKAGLIHSGYTRLPPVAWAYRDLIDGENPSQTISESDARRTSQVLHVAIRDLDPGR
jgi:hypothetical protein